MKRMLVAVLFGLIVGPMSTSKLYAQSGTYNYNAPSSVGWNANQNISADQLRSTLNLTSDQYQKMQAAISDRNDAVRPLFDQLKRGMDQLNSQVRSKASDADIQATLDQLDETHRAIQDANDRFLSDTASFLTPTQQAKLRLELSRNVNRGASYGAPGFDRGPGQTTTPAKPYQRPMGTPDRNIQEPGSVPGTEPQPTPSGR